MRHPTRLSLPLIGFFAAALLSGCALLRNESGSVPEVPELGGSEWVIDGLGGVGLVSGREPTLAFSADGRISGTTGCNRFFGSYTQDGAALTFPGTGMTKMACMEDGLMIQENAFAGVLNGAATATVDGLGELTLTGANGVGFVAKRAVPAGSAAEADPALLLGADWVVEDLNRGGVIDNTRLTLTFSADGKVSGSTNCNRFNGTYTATTTSVSFGPLAMTRRACTGEALSLQQRKYMDALGGVMTWTIEADGALVLTADGGKRVLLRR